MLMYNEAQEGERLLELLCETLSFVPRISRTYRLTEALETLLNGESQMISQKIKLTSNQKKKIFELIHQIKSRQKPGKNGTGLEDNGFDELKKIALKKQQYNDDALKSVKQCWENVLDTKALTEEQMQPYVEIALFCQESIQTGRYSINYRFAFDAKSKPYQVLAQTLAGMDLEQMQQATSGIRDIINNSDLKLDDCLFTTHSGSANEAVTGKPAAADDAANGEVTTDGQPIADDETTTDSVLNERKDDDSSFTGDIEEDDDKDSTPDDFKSNTTLLEKNEQERICYAVKILQLIPAMRTVLSIGYSLFCRLRSGNNTVEKSREIVREFANQQDENRDFIGEAVEQTLDVFDNQYSELSVLLTAMRQRPAVKEGNVVKLPAQWVAARQYSPETILLAAIVYRLAKKPNEYVAVPAGLESLGLYGNQEIHARNLYLTAQKNALKKIDSAKLFATDSKTGEEIRKTKQCLKAFDDSQAQQTMEDGTEDPNREDGADNMSQNIQPDGMEQLNDANQLNETSASADVAADNDNNPLLMFTSINKVTMVKLTELGYTQMKAAADAADEQTVCEASYPSADRSSMADLQAKTIDDLLKTIAEYQAPKMPSFGEYKERNDYIAMADEGGNELYQMMCKQPKVHDHERPKTDVSTLKLLGRFGRDDEDKQQLEDKLVQLKAAIKEHCFCNKTPKSLKDELLKQSDMPINADKLDKVALGLISFDAKSEVNKWINSTVRPTCMALLSFQINGVVLVCKENELVKKLCQLVDLLRVDDVKRFVKRISEDIPSNIVGKAEDQINNRLWVYDFMLGKDRDENALMEYTQVKGSGDTKEKAVCLYSTWHANADDTADSAASDAAIARELLHSTLLKKSSKYKLKYADRLWWPLYDLHSEKWKKICKGTDESMSRDELTLDYLLKLTPNDNNDPPHKYNLSFNWVKVKEKEGDNNTAVVEILDDENQDDKERRNKITQSIPEVDELRKNNSRAELEDKKEAYKLFQQKIDDKKYELTIGNKVYKGTGKQITMYPYFTENKQEVTENKQEVTENKQEVTIIGSLYIRIRSNKGGKAAQDNQPNASGIQCDDSKASNEQV